MHKHMSLRHVTWHSEPFQREPCLFLCHCFVQLRNHPSCILGFDTSARGIRKEQWEGLKLSPLQRGCHSLGTWWLTEAGGEKGGVVIRTVRGTERESGLNMVMPMFPPRRNRPPMKEFFWNREQGSVYQSEPEQAVLLEVTGLISEHSGVVPLFVFSCTSFYYGLMIYFVEFEIQRSP